MERATSFGTVADDYDRLRPSPPDAAMDWLLPPELRTVLDLGAGTGAMTRRLLERSPEVIAVEPDDRMRAVLQRRTPDVRAIAGSAEAIPLPDASVDAVVVASAWHWMDPAVAVPEIARVLKPGGRFAVVWTGHNTSAGWLRDLRQRVLPDGALSERLRRRIRQLDLPANAPFDPPENQRFGFTQPMSIDDLAASLGTYSNVITLGDDRAAALVTAARAWLVEQFGEAATVDVPMGSTGYRTNRIDRTDAASTT